MYNNLLCRYLDIFLGLLLLLSMFSLLYGSYGESSIFLIGFLALSLAVVIVYWCWYFYIKYAVTDYPAFDEQVSTSLLHPNMILLYLLYDFTLILNDSQVLFSDAHVYLLFDTDW